MRYDNGKEIGDFTAMENAILEKIYRIKDLSKLNKDIFLSLCRQIFYQDENNIVRTSWWGAADVTASIVGCSERQVRRAYREFVDRNMISKRLEIREEDINGRAVPRPVNWITINTDTKTWKVEERAMGDKKPRSMTKIVEP
jgi:hypothetical protein